MARDFDGVDDVIVSGLTTLSTHRSWGVWIWLDTTGEGGGGRVFEKDMELLFIRDAGTNLGF